MDIYKKSITELSELLQKKELSSINYFQNKPVVKFMNKLNLEPEKN